MTKKKPKKLKMLLPFALSIIGFVMRWFFICLGIGSAVFILADPYFDHLWRVIGLTFMCFCVYFIGFFLELVGEHILEERKGWPYT